MLKNSLIWRKPTGAALIISLVTLLSACEGNDDTPPVAQADPQSSTYGILARLEHRAQSMPPARQEELKGLDANNNGIRDDVDTYIAQRNYTPKQKKAVERYARDVQAAILVDKGNIATLEKMADADGRAIKCLHSINPRLSTETVATYETITANTPARAKAYMAFSHALNGSVWEMPRGDTCEN